eukprot:c19982_g1_i1 orf=281-3946(+)
MSVDVLHHLPDVGGFKLEEKHPVMPDLEASFSVRLFSEGFSVGKPLEKGKVVPPIHEAMGMLYPYNRASESFLRALDAGWIPGDLLEEIPCKYVNGCIACEVLDYCVNSSPTSDTGPTFSSKPMADVTPAVYKIMLKPTMESIAKDVSSMVDETWTYKDFMEVESKILKTAWPELHLDPKSTTNQTEKTALLRSGPKIFEQFRINKGAMANRRLRLLAASAKLKVGSLVNSKKIMAPERLVGDAIRDSSTTSSDAPIQIALKPKTSGPLSSAAQFPLSPKPSPALPEMMGVTTEKQSSLLGKRDGREFGGKLDMKKPKQDSPRPMDKGFGQKADQEQDLKALSNENTLEVLKIENSDQQRLDDSTRLRDENGGFGVPGGQSQLHDPQLLYQRLTQQDIDNQLWQVPGLAGDKDNKQDELLHRKRVMMMQQKFDGRAFQQQPLANDISRMAPGMAQIAASVVASGNPALAPSLSNDQLQISGAMAGGDQMPQSQQWSRRRTNSLPKNASNITEIVSPASTVNSGGIASINSPSIASVPPVVSVKSEGLINPGQRREPLDNLMVLMSVAQRHGLPAKRQKCELPPLSDGKKTAPPFHELECALNTSSDEIPDPKGQRNMADSLVGGNVNARKTRFLQFQRQIIQGPHFRRVRVRLVMCERGRDAMVEAVVQFGDDQDDETLNSVPHHVLPTMANAHAADIFAKQFCALLEKEGFELVEDQVQPTLPRGSATTNAACAARPLPAGATALGTSVGPLQSPRSLMNPHMPAMAGVGGIPGALASNRMPPPGMSSLQPSSPGNVTNRQFSGGYLSQSGITTSSGPASQLAAVQHPQQHQSPLHMQRAQQMVMPTQLAQLNHNPAQLNPQMVASPGQLQQFLHQQQQQQQRQQTQTSVFQRKIMGMGGLGAMGNLGGVGIPSSGGNQGGLGNMMGVNGMNNIVGMPGINNVSAAMGNMPGLNNVGQLQGMMALGQGNLIGRPGNISAAQMAAFTAKAHLTQGRSGHPMGAANSTARDNLSGLNASNQLHVSAGMPMMGQGMSRGRVGIQRAAPVGGLNSPRVATSNMPAGAAQGMYLNAPQQVGSQQQFNLQQLSPMQQTGQQQAIAAQQMQLTQPQQVSTQVQQQQPNPPQQLSLQQQQPKNAQQVLNMQTALLSQSQRQQPQQQQLNAQAQMNPASQQQNTVGSLGSIVGGPVSPQLSSQNVGSVTSAATLEPSATNCSATSLSSG